jgi:hypothetical protein
MQGDTHEECHEYDFGCVAWLAESQDNEESRSEEKHDGRDKYDRSDSVNEKDMFGHGIPLIWQRAREEVVNVPNSVGQEHDDSGADRENGEDNVEESVRDAWRVLETIRSRIHQVPPGRVTPIG